jgi:hypothetical protein
MHPSILLVRILSIIVVATPQTAKLNDKKESDQEILVKANTNILHRNIPNMVKSITNDISIDRPIARFVDPVCFEVHGLQNNANLVINNRISNNASKVGIKVIGSRCSAKVFILFVADDPKELIQLWEKRPHLFGSMSLLDIKKILHEPEPVHSILRISSRNKDGMPIVDKVLNTYSVSQIDLPTILAIESSVIIINRNSIVGMSLIQIADYLTMRSLLNSKASREVTNDSILGIFNVNSEDKPTEMTYFDREYIKGVYSGSGNTKSTLKLGQISRIISQGYKTNTISNK